MGKHIHLVSFLINSPINHTVLSWADPTTTGSKRWAT